MKFVLIFNPKNLFFIIYQLCYKTFESNGSSEANVINSLESGISIYQSFF